MTAEALWAQFAQDKDLSPTAYSAWPFGGAPDELAELVIRGMKTATCSLYFWYPYENEKLPAVGDYSVVLNGKGDAVCIIQTTKVYCTPYCSVSADHAYKEGEGDRTLTHWRRVHKAFFTQELSSTDTAFSEDMEVVCEEFQLVYTP